MADYNPSVALGVNSPDPNQGLKTLSGILGIGQQGLAIRGQQSENVTRAAQATEAAQNAKEKMGLVNLMQDPVGNGIVDADGNPTKDAQSIMARVAPTTYSEHYQGLLNGAKAKVEFNRSVNNLSAEERSETGGMFAGSAAGAQSPEQVHTDAENFLKSKEGLPTYDHFKRIVDTGLQVIDHVDSKQKDAGQIIPAGQEGWRKAALGIGRQVIGAAGVVGTGGVAAPSNATVDSGESIQPGATAPALQGGAFTPSGPPIKKVLPPGAVLVTDQNNRQFILNPQKNTISPVGEGGGPGAPAKVPQRFIQPAPDQKNSETEVAAARTAGDQYGLNAHINDRLLELSKDTRTGPGTETWHRVLGAVAGPFGGSPSGDYQKIGAYLDRQAALAVHGMGIPATNAGLETSKSISGNTDYSPEALQEKVKLTDALNEGAKAYRSGLDKAIGVGRNQDLNNYQPYRSAWAANFDPTIFALDAAHRRGDNEEVQKLISRMTPEQAKVIAQKTKNLRLLEQGQIPP